MPSDNLFAQGLVPCGQGNNPANSCTLCHLIIGIKNVVSFGQVILITVAAVAIFIGGFMYVIAAGDEGAMTTAKGFLSASLKGFAIFLLSWFIVNLVMVVLSFNTNLSIGKQNWYTFECSAVSSSAGDTSQPTAVATPTVPNKYCSCWNGSLIPFYYRAVGPEIYLPTADGCLKECLSRSAEYYRFDRGLYKLTVENEVPFIH